MRPRLRFPPADTRPAATHAATGTVAPLGVIVTLGPSPAVAPAVGAFGQVATLLRAPRPLRLMTRAAAAEAWLLTVFEPEVPSGTMAALAEAPVAAFRLIVETSGRLRPWGRGAGRRSGCR